MNYFYLQSCPLGTFPYVVKQGDTLYKIAMRYNTLVNAIIAANPGIDPNNLRIGQRLCIPIGRFVPNCPEGNFYSVKPGDTLYSIARENNIPLDMLIQANPGINPYFLWIGQIICIPKKTSDSECPQENVYVVKPGDTFYKIARNFNVSLDALLAANPNVDPDRLMIGQRICIPAPISHTCPENSIRYRIQAGDTFVKLATKFNTTVSAIINANPAVLPENLIIGEEICIPLLERIEIPVIIDEETEYREASLNRSDQGYFIYTLENYQFSGEEPGRDILYSTEDDSFFVRIEMIPRNADLNQLRENARTELGDIGRVSREDIQDPFFRENVFFLTASDREITKKILVKEIDGEIFKFTFFLPRKESSREILAEFYGMLKTIRMAR